MKLQSKQSAFLLFIAMCILFWTEASFGACPVDAAPPPSEWPRISLEFSEDVNHLGDSPQASFLFRACMLSGNDAEDEEMINGRLGDASIERLAAGRRLRMPQLASIGAASAPAESQRSRAHYLILGIGRPERLLARAGGGVDEVRSTRIGLGAKHFFIRYEDNDRGEYFSLFLGENLDALIDSDLDLGIAVRAGIEYSPPRSPIALHASVSFETLGDALVGKEEARIHIGFKVPLLYQRRAYER